MTTKEYIKKFNLSQTNKFNHSQFIEDLANDFLALLQLNKANDNIKGFDNAVRCIRMKYDAISNKTLGIFPDKLWNYFFATVIVKLREEICPKDMERKRQMQEQRKKAWEQRKAQFEWEQQQFSDFFWDYNFLSFLFSNKTQKPVDSFAILGLSENANEDDVRSAYKKLSMQCHPDKGGSQDDFIKITESKNKCLSWLSK